MPAQYLARAVTYPPIALVLIVADLGRPVATEKTTTKLLIG